jgi:hypothetical protein
VKTKQSELLNLIDSVKKKKKNKNKKTNKQTKNPPDIFGTETWIDSAIKDSHLQNSLCIGVKI